MGGNSRYPIAVIPVENLRIAGLFPVVHCAGSIVDGGSIGGGKARMYLWPCSSVYRVVLTSKGQKKTTLRRVAIRSQRRFDLTKSGVRRVGSPVFLQRNMSNIYAATLPSQGGGGEN